MPALRLGTLAALACIGAAYLAWFAVTESRITGGPLEWDERGWLASGLVYSGLFAHGDFAPAHWDGPRLTTWGNINPPLGKICVGWNAYQLSVKERLDYRPQVTAHRAAWGGLGPGAPTPPPLLLHEARATVRLWAALAAAVMVAAAWWLGGPAVAVVLAWTLLFNRVFMDHSTIAYTDAVYLLFHAVALLGAFAFARAERRCWQIAAILVLGLGAGLATSVKITGILIIGAYTIVLISSKLRRNVVSWKAAAAYLALFGVVGLAVIYTLNPFLWPDFRAIDRTALAEEWARFRQTEFATPEEGAPPRETLWESLTSIDLPTSRVRIDYPQLRNLLRPLEFPLLYPRWSRVFAQMAKDFPKESVVQVPYGAVVRFSTSLFEGAFLCYGLFVAVRLLRRDPGSPQGTLLATALIVFGVQLFFLAISLPVQGFSRYYLPTIVESRLFVALGVAAALRYPWKLVKGLVPQEPSGVTETSAL